MSYLKNMECWRLHPWSLRSAAKLSPPTAPLVTRLPGRGPRAGGSYPGTELCHVFCRARVTSLNPSSASHPFGCRHTARDSDWYHCSGWNLKVICTGQAIRQEIPTKVDVAVLSLKAVLRPNSFFLREPQYFLLRPSNNWMRPTHTTHSNLLYQSQVI